MISYFDFPGCITVVCDVQLYFLDRGLDDWFTQIVNDSSPIFRHESWKCVATMSGWSHHHCGQKNLKKNHCGQKKSTAIIVVTIISL